MMTTLYSNSDWCCDVRIHIQAAKTFHYASTSVLHEAKEAAEVMQQHAANSLVMAQKGASKKLPASSYIINQQQVEGCAMHWGRSQEGKST